MIHINVVKGDDIPFDALYPIMKDAFQERADQGLNFGCLSSSFDEFKTRLNKFTFLIARDADKNDKIIGFEKLDFVDDRLTCGLIAISPEYKRQGVGRLLFNTAEQLAKTNNCSYLLADTAVGAKSSVNWHKKNGFKIVGMKSWYNTNYYSYIFRKQLKYHALWSNNLYCMIRRLLSTIECKAKYKANGSYTELLLLYIKTHDRIRSFMSK